VVSCHQSRNRTAVDLSLRGRLPSFLELLAQLPERFGILIHCYALGTELRQSSAFLGVHFAGSIRR
jgi:hypothetical protein